MVLRGEKLDRPTYTILHTMSGEGNTGVCYRATHDVYGRDVVQKTVSLLGIDDAAARSEPALLNRLRHRHLVEVWEAQWDPDPQWSAVKAVTFVMPYYPGGTIYGNLMDGYKFSIGQAVSIACGVLDALHYLHVQQRLLHRDVKPDNVLLDEGRSWSYLSDLGSAAFMSPAGDADARGGTPLYRAPEAHTGRVGVAADVYGVGMVLLEMLNGPLPYDTLNHDRVAARLERGKPPVPARLLKPAPHVPDGLSLAVRRMISADPAVRPGSAREALRKLQAQGHMDWRSDVEGTRWTGRWPPSAGVRSRVFEARIERIESGRYAGKVLMSARWRHADSLNWRELRKLARRAAVDDDTAVRRFFRGIEEAAAHTPAA